MHNAAVLAPTLEQLSKTLMQRGWMMATAESCTGGMIAAACTDIAGSSAWFDRGFVTYSNASKTDMLGVPTSLIEQHGAVSKAVVCAMAAGALARSQASISVAVSGVAGPGGGTPEKPVGTVWLAWANPTQVLAQCKYFSGDRAQVRAQTLVYALQLLQVHAQAIDTAPSGSEQP
jgi:nicotinamide-nucleotide amidase